MSAVYTSIKSVNLALRFLLELCALVALAYWGSHTGTGLIAKIGLGIGAPLVAAVFWGIFVAPKASVTVPEPWHLILELLVFGSAVAGLVAAGRPTLGWALAATFTINLLLLNIWGQYMSDSFSLHPQERR